MPASTYALSIARGKTLEQVMLYSYPYLTYRPISALLSSAPVRFTVANHGIPENWPIRVQGVTSPVQLNTEEDKVVQAFIVDENTIELNALDASTWGTFEASGHVVFKTPAALAGWVFRMQVRTSIGGDVLLSLSSDPADGADGDILVDTAQSSFTLILPAAITAAIEWKGGVYDIEAIRPDGSVVSVIAPSPITVEPEITVWA